jgi:heat shock protein HtpX
VLIILSPIIAELIKLAISRKREYLADASAVLLTRYADGLANALRKISAQDAQLLRANRATAHLYLVNPFGAKKDSIKKRFSNLFSTHPPIEDRIRVLEEMGGTRTQSGN